MKISFFGAAGEVTGSCHLVETSRARVLIDFGLHQGGPEEDRHNLIPLPIPFDRLDAVVATHAHIDHIGRMPMLPRFGYRGPIFTTPATCDLATIMLRDSARLQEADADRYNRRRLRPGESPAQPLYTEAETEAVLPRFTPVPYNTPKEIAPGVTARWVDAGHMLGSASVELTIEDAGTKKIVVFSGDIGVRGAAMLNDPTLLRDADLVVMESTYGDRDHKPLGPTLEEFAGIIHDAVWNKQKVLIPAFAVGRSQQMIYHLGELVRTERLPRFPIYLDSPMAVAATELYRKYQTDLDSDMRGLIRAGCNPLRLDDLVCTASSEESKALNDFHGAAVIIAASGMCNGGRILHHLMHNAWKKDVRIIIAGFQAQGTIGRQLVEGARFIQIFGQRIEVRARVSTLGGFSAHAGQSELVGWAEAFTRSGDRPRYVLVHGEPAARDVLRHTLRDRLGIEAVCPSFAASVTL